MSTYAQKRKQLWKYQRVGGELMMQEERHHCVPKCLLVAGYFCNGRRIEKGEEEIIYQRADEISQDRFGVTFAKLDCTQEILIQLLTEKGYGPAPFSYTHRFYALRRLYATANCWPVIINIENGEHWVVVRACRTGLEPKKICIQDPQRTAENMSYGGQRDFTEKELASIWRHRNDKKETYYGIIVKPSKT